MSGIVGSYFNTRGSGVVAKLGTDGQVFTSTGAGLSQGFEAAAGGGAWNLIKSQSITSSTADMEWIDGTSDVVLDNTYKCYVLLMTDYLAENDESSLDIQISTDTGSTYETSGYYTVGSESFYGAAQGNQQIVDTGSMVMRNHIGNDATETVQGQLWIYNPSSATTYPTMGWQFYFAMGGGGMARPINGVGGYQTATAYDAFRIIPDSGNIINLQASLYGITT